MFYSSLSCCIGLKYNYRKAILFASSNKFLRKNGFSVKEYLFDLSKVLGKKICKIA